MVQDVAANWIGSFAAQLTFHELVLLLILEQQCLEILTFEIPYSLKSFSHIGSCLY